MFNAYSVAVKVKLVDQVTAGLLAMSRQFNMVNGNALVLQERLNKIKILGMAGAGISAVGFMGLGIIGKMIKPATEYAHQLNIINMAGWTQRDIANAVGDAWKNTGTVITTTATENLRTLLDLKNVLGDLGEARMALPVVSRIQGVLAASSEGQISGNSKELAYGMAKALDIIGAAQNKESFERQAEMMAKVIIATQGRVTPEAFKSTFQYARQAKYRLSDEFKYEILPSLIQENAAGGGGGGGSRGVGPMLSAFYRWANQGYINKKSMPELVSLGLVDANSVLKTTTSGTTAGAMTSSDLAASNPFQWVQTVLVPAIKRKYGQDITRDQLLMHINEITRGNQLAGNLVGEFAFKPVNFTRDQANIRGTMSTADAYKAALSNDPNTAYKALGAQWENFKTAFMMGVVPVLIPALIKLTNMFNSLAAWARENPNLAKDLAVGFTALFGAMALGGTVLMVTSAFKGLGLVLTAGGGLAGLLTGTAGGLGSLALVAGKFLAVYAAWEVGQAVGGVINSGLNSATSFLSGGTSKTLGEGIYNLTHPSTDDGFVIPRSMRNQSNNALNVPATAGAFPLKQPAHAASTAGIPVPVRSRTTINNKIVMPDGRVLAQVVTHEQARDAFRPLSSSTGFDGTLMPAHVGMR